MIAVDPTSPFTGGAVLGDRLRMQSHAGDEGVFIRSMATRGHLGGLARATGDAALVLDAAGKDIVIIETVGVGQDEVDIVRTADVSIVTLVPGTGDEVQALKAGIMEIADIFVVNKADREGADRLVSAVEAILALHPYGDRRVAAADCENRSRPPAGACRELVEAIRTVPRAPRQFDRRRRSGAAARRAEHRLRELVTRRSWTQLERERAERRANSAALVDSHRRARDRSVHAPQTGLLVLDAILESTGRMKAVLDHIGIAVRDLRCGAGVLSRCARASRSRPPEEVASQRVRAHFIPVGESTLELLEATAPDSPIAKYIEKRGPGLHHITLRVEDIACGARQLKARGARLIDEQPRPGAEGALVAFIHPSSAHGVLVELKQSPANLNDLHNADNPRSRGTRVGDLELISRLRRFVPARRRLRCSVSCRRRCGASGARRRSATASRWRVRPLVVRGARTMLIDAGFGDKTDDAFRDIFALDRAPQSGSRARRGRHRPRRHRHRARDAPAFGSRRRIHDARRGRPRFGRAFRARGMSSAGASGKTRRSRTSGTAPATWPTTSCRLTDAGVLELVDDDQTIMPGVKVRRTGGHTRHHQMVSIESGGQRAAFRGRSDADDGASLDCRGLHGFDLFPVDTLASKQAFVQEAVAQHTLVFFDHDPQLRRGLHRRAERQTDPLQPL